MGGMMGGRIDDGKHDELYKNEKIVVKVKLIKKKLMCSALLFLSSCSSLIPVQDVCGGQLLEGWGNMLTAAVD